MCEEPRTCCEIYDEDGGLVALGLLGEDESIEILAGSSPETGEVVPVEPSRCPIALFADEGGLIEREINALYPDRVVGPEELDGARYAVVACEDEGLRERVDWACLDDFARRGGVVIASLDDYAHSRGLTLKQRTRVDRPHLEVSPRIRCSWAPP